MECRPVVLLWSLGQTRQYLRTNIMGVWPRPYRLAIGPFDPVPRLFQKIEKKETENRDISILHWGKDIT